MLEFPEEVTDTSDEDKGTAKVDRIVNMLLSLSADELDLAIEELNRRRRVGKK